jgi:hypothetical protein
MQTKNIEESKVKAEMEKCVVDCADNHIKMMNGITFVNRRKKCCSTTVQALGHITLILGYEWSSLLKNLA